MGVFRNIDQGEIAWLVYTAGQGETVDSYTKGMLQHNAMEGVLVPSIFQRDEILEVKYNVTGYRSLREFCLEPLTVTDFHEILQSIVTIVQTAEGDYMIDSGNFCFEPEHIYIQPETKKAVMICLPLLNVSSGTGFAEFIRDFLIGSRFSEKEDLSYVAKFINLINSEEVTIQTIGKQLDQLSPGKAKTGEERTSRETRNRPKQEQKQEPAPEVHPSYPTPVSTMPSVGVPGGNEEVSAEKTKKGLFGFGKTASVADKKTKTEKVSLSKKKEAGGSLPSGIAGMPIPGQMPSSAAPVSGMNIPGVMPGTPADAKPLEKKNSKFSLHLGKKEKTEKKDDTKAFSAAIPGMDAGGSDATGSVSSTGFLVRESNGARFMLTKPVMHIGKKRDYADIYVDGNRTVSSAHADVIYRDGQHYLRDTNSLNHSFVNGVQVDPGEEMVLQDGDTVRLANENFTYRVGK